MKSLPRRALRIIAASAGLIVSLCAVRILFSWRAPALGTSVAAVPAAWEIQPSVKPGKLTALPSSVELRRLDATGWLRLGDEIHSLTSLERGRLLDEAHSM